MNQKDVLRGLHYYIIPTFATILFLIFSSESVNEWFSMYIPHPGYRIVAFALLFFVLVYLFERLFVWYVRVR